MDNSVRTTTLLNGRKNFHHINVYYRKGSELDKDFLTKRGFQQPGVRKFRFQRESCENIVNYNAIKPLS